MELCLLFLLFTRSILPGLFVSVCFAMCFASASMSSLYILLSGRSQMTAEMILIRDHASVENNNIDFTFAQN
jgi:hypothetical protein